MPRRIESLFLAGPAGKLEALLEEPEHGSLVEAALVCHPHPQHGGTMHNKVVYRLARGLRKSGCVVLRFNYRGVNLSEGEYAHEIGETEDARVALSELHSRYPELPMLAAGFSFGSRVVLRLASEEQTIRRVIAVGFPTRPAERTGRGAPGPCRPGSPVVRDYRKVERDFVSNVHVPKYFIQSTHDEFSPRTSFAPFYDSLPAPKHLDWIEASDHFFRDALDVFEAAVLKVGNTR